jgi:hypothetical protein
LPPHNPDESDGRDRGGDHTDEKTPEPVRDPAAQILCGQLPCVLVGEPEDVTERQVGHGHNAGDDHGERGGAHDPAAPDAGQSIAEPGDRTARQDQEGDDPNCEPG